MNTFWRKIVGLVIVVVAVIFLVNAFRNWRNRPRPEAKTFYDVTRNDDKRLRAAPQPREQPIERQAPARQQASRTQESPRPSTAVGPAEQPKPHFRELSEIERIDAERLFEVAIQHRKMGRLRGIGLKTMVDCCRQIIQKYPDSIYAFRAKRMLADIPERFRSRYHITDEEINLGNLK